jgi:hypothetical protein
MNLENKRLQFTAQWLTPALAFIVAIITISNSLGLERTLYLAVIVALVGWIIANQAVQRTLPKKSSLQEPPSSDEHRGAYGCIYCAEPRIMLPPDSQYIFLRLDPCSHDDSRKIEWVCKNCRKVNVRYWDRYHPYDRPC